MIFNKLSREAPNPDTESHEPITMCMKVFNIHGNKRFNELTRIQRELTNLTILKNEEQILHVLWFSAGWLLSCMALPIFLMVSSACLPSIIKTRHLAIICIVFLYTRISFRWDVQKRTDSLKPYNIEETFKDEIPIVKSLISAMRVLYDKKIMHRDLKV